ncbi:hypothetical protein Syun_014368 [Stephania yunnanensis]|uniref:Uncharacterized protein n=1 Tax=Stephania yunnanensis TaxID=152371 RepID=A0AAP0P8I2_9MAGN
MEIKEGTNSFPCDLRRRVHDGHRADYSSTSKKQKKKRGAAILVLIPPVRGV